jgi:PTS system mannose-specific IID component
VFVSGLVRAWLRLFTVQASWNYERMVGTGVGFATEPLLDEVRVERGPASAKAALARATRYFNAHPYFTAFAVGAQARAERDGVPPHQVERLRQALAAPLGSMGDRLVWAGWLPATAALGLLITVLGHPWIGVFLFLGLYNAMHITLRTWGLLAGWRLGLGVGRALAKPVLRRSVGAAPAVAGFALGLALPAAARWGTALVAPAAWWAMAGVVAATVVLGRWLFPSLGGVRLAMLLLAAGALAELVWP